MKKMKIPTDLIDWWAAHYGFCAHCQWRNSGPCVMPVCMRKQEVLAYGAGRAQAKSRLAAALSGLFEDGSKAASKEAGSADGSNGDNAANDRDAGQRSAGPESGNGGASTGRAMDDLIELLDERRIAKMEAQV